MMIKIAERIYVNSSDICRVEHIVEGSNEFIAYWLHGVDEKKILAGPYYKEFKRRLCIGECTYDERDSRPKTI
jgi:hypothetical protein